jgi:anti-anti-sigma factor
MEITASRTGEQLVLSLTGRMDGTGAQQVTAAIQQNLTDHDTALIFDLGSVDYLSSAGLRVFQESARRMKERKGRIAVCRTQDFVRKLFTSGGFFRVLADFPTIESALAGTTGAAMPPAGEVTISGEGWTISAHHLTGTPGTLTVTGNLGSLHAGKVAAADARETQVPPGGFCTGIGAMAKTREAASPLMGEMLQAGGTVYWIPTDGNSNPDFFTAQDLASSGMKTFTLFSASFTGPFADVLRITSEKPEGMTLTELYAAVFRYLKEQYPGFSGACVVCLKATIGGLCSSDLKNSLVAAAADRAAKGPAAMPFGKTVTEYPLEGTVIDKASVVDVKPRYAGDILISIGYGIDPVTARKTFPQEQLAALSYTDTRTSGTGLFLYNKGLVFKNLPWDNAKPFEAQLRAAPASGGFVAMHNLLPVTTVKSAVAGILPVSVIRNGE